MAWMKVDETLCDHPKVLIVAEALKLDKDAVTGKLIRLWTWALNNREDGCLARQDAGTITEIMRFKGKATRLMDALVTAGFLDVTDDGWSIHNWTDYAGTFVEKRAAAVERKQRERQRKKCDKSVTHSNENSANDAHEQRDISVTETGQARDENVNVTLLEKEKEKEKEIYTTAASARAHTHAYAREETPLRDNRYAALIDTYTLNIRMPSPIEAESISQWMDDMPPDVIDFAIKQAALSGIRSWRGVETILLRWKEIGVKALAEAEAAQREWANRGQPQSKTPAPRTQGTLGRVISNLDALMAQTLEEEDGHYHES